MKKRKKNKKKGIIFAMHGSTYKEIVIFLTSMVI